MNKMKKTGFLKAAGLMLAVMMPAAFAVSQTMAKYTSTGTVGGLTVSVAKWDVTVGNSTLGELEIDLSDLTWTIEKDVDYTLDIATGVIAPGTWGYLEIPIVNMSDVDAIVAISGEITAPDDATNLDVKVVAMSDQVSDPASYGEMISDEKGKQAFGDGVGLEKSSDTGDAGGTIYLYVCYQWPFDGDDIQDSYLAETYSGSTLDFTGSLTITATQAKEAISS